MGCDIHLCVEQRQPDGTWQRVERWEPEPWDENRQRRERWYTGRNYTLFALLADVRNGDGREVVPISEPRGLPEDVSDETRAESDDWGMDGHSHSWFSQADLLAFDWWAEGKHSGLMDDHSPNPDSRFAEGGRVAAAQEYADEYRELPPWANEYSQGVWGPGAEHYKRITWMEPHWRSVGPAFPALLVRLSALAGNDLSSVRIVFWFDN